jgi:FMN reductase (NADPH)/FMN reductase [NAD(P)H]
MNETLSLIDRRRSTRAYLNEPLTQAEKDAILHAAFRAPTGGNMMLYTIIAVEDQALKDRLAETCDHQPFIARAPFVLLFLADYQRWFDYFTLSGVEERCRELGLAYRLPQEGDLLLACCDALIAAQNAVIAAESLGIGSCYIGDILENAEIHRDLFSLPRYTLPITLLCFGRPTREHDTASPTPRFAPEFIVQRNAYHRLNAAELERMAAPSQDRVFSAGQAASGALNYGQHQYLHKFIADFSVEMNRSVREMLKNWQ